MKHYKEEISAYIDRELTASEQRLVAEHLLLCSDCRKEHDRIKAATELVVQLPRVDAPESVWKKIEDSLNDRGRESEKTFSRPFVWRYAALASALILVSGVAFYFVWSRQDNDNLARQPAATEFAEWSVNRITGTPKNNGQSLSENEILNVGETLETDHHSTAEVRVANIGQIEVAPNSRLTLVRTESTEHRLSLEHGSLKAFIIAPPRLFIVDTPSAAAVDLGCAYTLDVDQNGNSKLRVTSGYVALERDGYESIVVAGAMAETRKGIGVGTPYFENSSEAFRKALISFDFEKRDSDALKTILKESVKQDSLTLWHLLSRTNGDDRRRVFEKLSGFIKPPTEATKQGILNLEKPMLKLWFDQITSTSF